MMNVTNPINSTNNLNYINNFNAKKAFLNNTNDNVKNAEKEDMELKHINNSILNKIDVSEVQKYATGLGGNNLTEDELKYGLVFGRSVLVNIQA